MDFELSSLWHRAYTFRRIALDAPVLNASIAPDGFINLLALQPKPSSPHATAERSAKNDSLPAVSIASFNVTGGSLSYEDRSHPSAFAARLEPITFELRDFSTGVAVGLTAVVVALLASYDTKSAEAFQLLVTCGFVCYGVNYLLMFAVPLLLGTRFSLRRDIRAPFAVRAACLCGALVTVLAMAFNLVPIVDVASPAMFALTVGGATILLNLLAGLVYWSGSRRAAA